MRQTGFSTKVGSTTEIRPGSDVVVVSEPTLGATLRTKGRFYFLCEVMPQGKPGSDVAREVADLTREQYEYDLSAGIEVAIRKALRDANRRAAHRLRDQHGRVALHAACAVLVNNELYAARIGQAQIFLVRRARLFLPGDDPNELADFVHRTTTRRAASLGSDPDLLPSVWKQTIEPGDTIILAGGNAVAALGADALLNAAVTLHPRAAAEHLHERFVADGGSGSDSILFVEVSLASTTAPRIASAPPHRLPEEVLVAETIRSRVDAFWSRRPRIGRVIGAVASPAAGAVGKTLAIGLELMPHRTTTLGGPMRTARERSARQQRLISLLAVALLGVSIVIGAVVVRDFQANNVVASYNLTVLAASNDLDSAQTFLDRKPFADLERARQRLDSARTHIGDAAASPAANTQQLATLTARADALSDRLGSVLIDLASVASGAKPVSFTQTQFGLYAADPGSGRMWRVFEQPPGTTVAGPVLQKGTPAGVGTPLFVTSVANALFTVDDLNKIWKAEGNSVVEVSPDGRDKWKSVNGLVSFSGTLYVLDAASGQIWRHEEDRGKYLAADPVFAQTLSPNVITSFAVDGSIWITTTAGDIGLFKRVGLATTAAKVDFTPKWIGAPVKATMIQAIDSQGSIYVLDAPGRRIVQLTRDGREVARFDLPKDLLPPTAFFVSEGQRIAYTAHGSKIAATDLSR